MLPYSFISITTAVSYLLSKTLLIRLCSPLNLQGLIQIIPNSSVYLAGFQRRCAQPFNAVYIQERLVFASLALMIF